MLTSAVTPLGMRTVWYTMKEIMRDAETAEMTIGRSAVFIPVIRVRPSLNFRKMMVVRRMHPDANPTFGRNVEILRLCSIRVRSTLNRTLKIGFLIILVRRL